MRKQQDQYKNRDADGLNWKESLFCRLYLSGTNSRGNGAQAAREAGYTGDCNKRASVMLGDPRIAAVIERERARLLKKVDITAERVLRELAMIAFFDVRRLFKPNGTLVPLSTLDAETAAVISGADLKRAGVLRLRFSSKIHALEMLGRYLKLWDGVGSPKNDRLSEVIAAFREGPATTTVQ